MASGLVLGYLIPIVAGLAGIVIMFRIAIKKRRSKAGNTSCDVVLQSEYSFFLGIPVEGLGILYFSIVLLAHALFLLYPIHSLIVAVFVCTVVALLFSFYLTYIQIVTLRKACLWCLLSAVLCCVIFFASLYGIPELYERIREILTSWQEVIVGIKLLGIAIALGGATLDQLFFYRFLSDYKISTWESSILQAISQVTWIGLLIFLLAFVGIFLADPVVSGITYAQLVVLGIIILSDTYANLTIAPRLIHIAFDTKHKKETRTSKRDRSLAFAGGAISIVSWYTLFILVLLPDHIARFWVIVSLYSVLVIAAIIASRIAEQRMVNRKRV